jgi:putative protein-disulfide isomerase
MSDQIAFRATYLFDPLCGWCYGAAPMIERLSQTGALAALVPVGLFAGHNARPLDAGFASYAWANDQRIAQLTGQAFSEDYRSKVLGASDGTLDSGPATLALTAVGVTAPDREAQALKAIQRGRYVTGADITDLASLGDILAGIGLAAAAERVRRPDDALREASGQSITVGRRLMAEIGARGVPALVVETAKGGRLLPAEALLGSFEDLQRYLGA